jgi:SAM-dependent methyltransferase
MELYSAEAETIRKMVAEWHQRQDTELEATFHKGEVDASTFLAIAQRLRAKGYKDLPQEDHLTITTPEHIRFTLSSYAIIEQYCADDTIAGKPYIAIMKNRTVSDSQVDLEDYDTKIKSRVETPLPESKLQEVLMGWTQQRKAFRLIRRWTFLGDGFKVDMSIVRSTKRDARGEYRWQRKFTDQDIINTPPKYEVEVELLHLPNDSVELAMKRLIKGIGEVLRGIQKHVLLVRKSQKEHVLSVYHEITGTKLFRGPAMKTLLKENYSKERAPGKPNIRDGYNVTDKADGLRCLGLVDSKGELFLLDMGMNVYRTGLQQLELRLSLVDGEWVTKTHDNKPLQQFLVFDIFYTTDKRDVSQFPFQPGAVPPAQTRPAGPAGEEGPPIVAAAPPPEDSRHHHMTRWVETWNKPEGGSKVIAPGVTATTKLQISAKEFLFAKPGKGSIFQFATRVWSYARPYYTDGLIFTPNADPLPKQPAATFAGQFKWKPPRDNTIDFLIVTEKDKGTQQDKIITGIKPVTGETVTYKTLRLYVGSRTENPRELLLHKKPLPAGDKTFQGKRGKDYKPVLFTPREFPDPYASVCYLPVETDPSTREIYVKTELGEPIQDKTIVEMAYNPSNPPGWRWIPLRLRMDKTQRFQSGTLSKTLNADIVAEDVWNSIYDPITESMICSGSEDPSEEEMAALAGDAASRELAARRYFDRRAPVVDQQLTRPLVKFHNRWIKERILYPVGLSGPGKMMLDLACGQGNDLHMWRRVGVKFVLGVDYAAKNILDPNDGAYARYMQVATTEGGMQKIEPMLFAIADASKPLVNGEAGATDEEKDLLRAVFGQQRPLGPVPAYITELQGRLRAKADCVSCMFALHYFFESKQKFQALLRNINDTLKIGGYFIGCCFDGESVFDALRDKAIGDSIVGQEKLATLWKITKQYELETLMDENDGFGVGVDVQFATIGMAHREYLVPFAVLEEQMKRIGCELLTQEELDEVGLKNSTAMFGTSWEMAKQRGEIFTMTPAAERFSFFNRWFIFKRKREIVVADEMIEKAAAAAEAAAAPVAPAVPRSRNRAPTMAAELEKVANAAPEVPAAAAAAAPATYSSKQIFLFYSDAALTDKLGIEDTGAGRWLAPSAAFPITDPEDPDVSYPTLEHFMAGMQLKVASNKPELGPAIFGKEGTIHQQFLSNRLTESDGGRKPLPEERNHALTKLEMKAVKDELRPAALKKYKVVIDMAKWSTFHDALLREAVQQRWTKDARFRRIVEAARQQDKVLLYYTPGASISGIGGVHKQDGRIEGTNKLGKMIMEAAGYTKGTG